jgi:DNA-binding CsgD family transcriptional regulator
MQPHLTESWFPEEPLRNSSRATPPLVSQTFEPEVYEWQVYGKALSIHIRLDVIDRLQRDLLESSYGAGEVAGVLLGRVTASGFRSVVVVEDYELAHDSGAPASALAEQKQLADMVAKWNRHSSRHAVGLFRSQSRAWIALSDRDLELASCLFPRLDNIFLVVRPSPGAEPRAGFFFWEGNQIQSNQSYSEFTFDSRALGGQSGHGLHALNFDGAAWDEATSHSFMQSVRSSWVTLALTWGLALGCTLTGVNALGTHGPGAGPAVNSAPAATTATFNVDYHGQKIEVNLNHGLPSEMERENGTLSERQTQLLRYIAEDLPKDEIASKLGITPEAVDIHKEVLAHKLGVAGEAGLVRYAIKAGLVQL